MDLDPNQLFHLQLLNAAKEYGDDIALVDYETKENLTFMNFYKKCYQFAKILSSYMDEKSNDYGTILIFLQNSINYPIIFCGSALLGHPICGINPETTKDELQNIIKKSDTKFIICSTLTLNTVKLLNINDKIKILSYGKINKNDKYPHGKIISLDNELLTTSFDDELVTTLSAKSRALNTVNHVLFAPLSSGTTGESKCVLLTHTNFISATNILNRGLFGKLGSSGGRRSNLAFLPFYHASGFWALCYCLLNGHRTIIMSSFQPIAMMKCIEEYQIDVLNLVPSLVKYLTDNVEQFDCYNISSLKTILCGSAPISKEQINEFLSKYPEIQDFIQGYGMTEIVCLSHLTPLGNSANDEKHFGSCGKLLDGFEAKLIDPETDEIKTNPHETGELWLRSDCVMKGYLHDDEKTNISLDPSGWLKTGDILYFDEDGYYYVVDRLKEIIKVNGLQVSPVELERLLLSLEYVKEAAIIGIHDADFGQVPMAFVVLNKDKIEGEINEILETIKDYVHSKVSPHKQLKGGIIHLENMPKTSTGKIVKSELQQLVNAEHETVL